MADGACVYNDNAIYLSNDFLTKHQHQHIAVLLHEVVHAIRFYTDEDQDETRVETTAQLLLQFLGSLK
jgi:hypothetical protein